MKKLFCVLLLLAWPVQAGEFGMSDLWYKVLQPGIILDPGFDMGLDHWRGRRRLTMTKRAR